MRRGECIMDLSGSNEKYGVSSGVIFRPRDRVRLRDHPDIECRIVDFLSETIVIVKEIEGDFTSTCDLDALTKIEEPKTKIKEPDQKKIEEFPELEDVADYIQRATGHEGVKKSSCTNCGRTLTAPRSIACHYGPVCFRKIFGKDQPRTEEEKLKRFKRISIKISEIDYSQLTDARDYFV